MATAKMKGLYVRLQMWNGGYKQACAVTTFKSLIGNMMIGTKEDFDDTVGIHPTVAEAFTTIHATKRAGDDP